MGEKFFAPPCDPEPDERFMSSLAGVVSALEDFVFRVFAFAVKITSAC